MDGRELATILKNESSDTPIVMLTGWGAFMKDDGQLPPQIDGILCKPPRIREVRAMLRQVIAPKPGPARKRPPTAPQAVLV